jgi:hypothetical protein
MEKINIYLDDDRHNYDSYTYTKDTRYLQLKWFIVRNYNDFVKAVENIGLDNIGVISLDHDLADEHYKRQDQQPWSTERSIDYFAYKEKTGYECAKWLCDYSLEVDEKLPEILVHSMNSVGAENIRQYIKNFIKHTQ